MPWQANNNAPGQIRAPAAQLCQDEKKDSVLGVWTTTRSSKLAGVDCESGNCVYIHPSSFSARNERCFIYPRSYPTHVVLLCFDERVPLNRIALSEVQLVNLELCEDQEEEWRCYDASKDANAYSISIEVRPLEPRSITLDANAFEQVLKKYCWNRILTENERLIVVGPENVQYFVRVVEIEADDNDETDFTMPDVFRAMVDDQTRVYMVSELPLDDEFFQLEGALAKKDAPPRDDIVTVITTDDEEFPVKKKLLHPCIKLSSAVLAGKGVHKMASRTIKVDLDCCTFDRVLLYLEHEARNSAESYYFDPIYTEDFLKAAETVGCIGLEDVCRKRLGEFESRVRKLAIGWDEVVQHNTNGDVWLVMDGMVFDVTRWLPEHPGGSTIIPAQAVNVDCTVMFEIYHSSRQSFRYLKQFYIGEISEQDKSRVPPSEHQPSDAFRDELRNYTTWRIKPLEKIFKSF